MKYFLQQLKIVQLSIFTNPIFIVKIVEGKVLKVSGKVKPNFIKELKDIIQRNAIDHGVIYAVKGNFNSTTVKATSTIPATVLQTIRNVFRFD